MNQKFDIAKFVSPDKQFRGIPFWSWNCKITRELIDTQLDYFREMGFGGVDIHPRVGLDTEYLGGEYMELIQYTVEKCKEKGMICWLYDDDRYPSGAADGFVTRNMNYRLRELLLTIQRRDNFCQTREEFEEAISAGGCPKGYYVCAYALDFQDGLLRHYDRLQSECEIQAAVTNGRIVRYAYVRLSSESDHFHGQTYVDVLNPEAIDEFIRVTHERYYDAVGSEFAKSVQAIFTDEPRIGNQNFIPSADAAVDCEIPYTEIFREFMLDYCGVDVLSIVPELVWDLPDHGSYRSRYLYREALAEQFTRAYMDNIGAWCKKHNILMTGHILCETPLANQASTSGECMRNYRSMDIPGLDILCDAHEFVSAKQVASVSKQMDKQGTMSEEYGVTGWFCSFRTYKLQGDWQAALGITVRVPHLSFMSMAGEAKRDWPASISFQSPWYKEYSYIENYFGRVNYVLNHGKPVTKVAVLHPIESIWLHMGQADKNGEAICKIQSTFEKITDTLLFGTIDTDYISESMLPNLCDRVSAPLTVGKMQYHTIIVPAMDTIRSTTLAILAEFNANGGRVIFTADAPQYVDALSSPKAVEFAALCETVSVTGLLDALESERDIKITDRNGKLSDNLFYQLRESESERWLFICHVKDSVCDSTEPESYTIRLNGHYTAKSLDAMAGNEKNIAVSYCGANTCITWNTYPQDSILLRLETCEVGHTIVSDDIASTYADNERYTVVTRLSRPHSVRLSEKNVLLLDYAAYRVDDGVLHNRTEILKADDNIRGQLGFCKRSEHMLQPWATERKENHKVELCYDVFSEIETDVELALEIPEICEIYLNSRKVDITVTGYYVDPAISVISLPGLQKGRNELRLEIGFNQKTNLENMYLLGNFRVKLDGSNARIQDWDTAGNAGIELGDITVQGMPFYTGNVDYTFEVNAEAQTEYFIRVPRFNAPVMAIYVDGSKTGLIAYAPYRTSLGVLDVGKHEIRVCLYGNRQNSFGALHNANQKNKWIGPTAYRTTGVDWTDDYMLRPMGILSEILIEQKTI